MVSRTGASDASMMLLKLCPTLPQSSKIVVEINDTTGSLQNKGNKGKMFTGLIEELGEVAERGNEKLRIRAKTVLEGTRLGDSICVNGACLTVTSADPHSFTVGVSPE